MDAAILKTAHDLIQAAAKRGDRDGVIAEIATGACHLCADGGLELPERMYDLLDAVLAKRGKVRFLRNARKGSSERARVLRERMRWHSGLSSGSLWGPMVSVVTVGHEEFDRLDTLALLTVAMVTGTVNESASLTWARALGQR